MFKVQTLRSRGLCFSSLLALAACSGTTPNQPSAVDGTVDSANASVTSATAEMPAQDPQGQDPQQDPRPGVQGLINQALQNARQSLEDRRFEDARNEAAFALELDNQNAEARDILRRAREVLGDDPAAVRGRFDSEILQERIAFERQRALVESELQQGAALQAQGSYQDAIDAYERALATIRFSIYFQPNDPLRREVQSRLEAASQMKLDSDRAALQARESASQEELDQLQRDRKEQRQTQVQRLLKDANLKFQSGQYEDSVELLDEALLLEPRNPITQSLRDLADRARFNATMEVTRERWQLEWNETILEMRQANMPQTETVVFDPMRWAEVSQRKPAQFSKPSELDSPEDRAIRKRLEDTITKHILPSATVDAWAAYYGNLTGVTFVVSTDVADMDAEETTLVDFNLSERSVADALKVIRSQTGVAHRIQNGLVELVTPDMATGIIYYERYPVSDLVQGFKPNPGPDLKLRSPDDDTPLFPEVDEEPMPAVVDDQRLQEILQEAVAPGKWDDQFNMTYQAGLLLVRADKPAQEGIVKMLGDLRKLVGIQVDVESRFLKVEDNFLEDVGVDLRGLGNQASQGIPGRGLENNPNAGFDDYGPSQLQNPATPGILGTGTEPGIFYDDGGDGDVMARVENLYDTTLGGRNGALTNAGGLSVEYTFLDDTEVEAILRAVSKQERSEQIEAPRLLIYNNTRASMFFVRNISYISDFEVEIAQAAAVANPVIGTVQDGIALDVRPVTDSDLEFITMELRPTVLALQLPIPTFTTTLGVGQPISIQLPEVTLQQVRTCVTLPDGGTMMLGGMRLVERQNIVSGVPVLKDLPGLSFLFSRKGTSLQNRKILILIRAKIVVMEELEPKAIAMPDGSILTADAR